MQTSRFSPTRRCLSCDVAALHFTTRQPPHKLRLSEAIGFEVKGTANASVSTNIS